MTFLKVFSNHVILIYKTFFKFLCSWKKTFEDSHLLNITIEKLIKNAIVKLFGNFILTIYLFVS